ncbi:MAG: hypothetical protein GY943_31825 [Chloroflexi bacterium]|nr:hypothetical protein [Chloroflexota bacterium]
MNTRERAQLLETIQSRYDLNALHKVMLGKVHNHWIKGVLENSLHGAAWLELGLDEEKP